MIGAIAHLNAVRSMLVFTVHEQPRPPADRLGRAEALVFVRDGFSWGAFLFGPLWLALNGLWLVLLGYLAIMTGVGSALEALDVHDGWIGLVALALQVMLGFEADTLTRWSLARKGWRMVGTVAGSNRLACERRFLDAWLAHHRNAGGPETLHVTASGPLAADRAGGERRVWTAFLSRLRGARA